MTPLIIDTHTHIVSPSLNDYPQSTIAHPSGSKWFEEMPISAEDLLVKLDSAQVAGAVLVQPYLPYEYDNSYVADSAVLHHERFVGVCMVDPAAPDAGNRLRYWVEERGSRGVRFFAMGVGLRKKAWDTPGSSFWTSAARLAVPVTLQIELEDVERLPMLAHEYPELPLILDHVGATFVDGLTLDDISGVLALAAFPNIFVKYSTVTLDSLLAGNDAVTKFITRLVALFGHERIIWGSNFPATHGDSYPELVQRGIQSVASLSDNDQRAILGGNAARIWQLPQPTQK